MSITWLSKVIILKWIYFGIKSLFVLGRIYLDELSTISKHFTFHFSWNHQSLNICHSVTSQNRIQVDLSRCCNFIFAWFDILSLKRVMQSCKNSNSCLNKRKAHFVKEHCGASCYEQSCNDMLGKGPVLSCLCGIDQDIIPDHRKQSTCEENKWNKPPLKSLWNRNSVICCHHVTSTAHDQLLHITAVLHAFKGTGLVNFEIPPKVLQLIVHCHCWCLNCSCRVYRDWSGCSKRVFLHL